MCTGVPSLRFSVHEYLFLFFSPFARVTTVIRYTNRVIILSTVVKYIMAPPPIPVQSTSRGEGFWKHVESKQETEE